MRRPLIQSAVKAPTYRLISVGERKFEYKSHQKQTWAHQVLARNYYNDITSHIFTSIMQANVAGKIVPCLP
jgi:hypothetical protein